MLAKERKRRKKKVSPASDVCFVLPASSAGRRGFVAQPWRESGLQGKCRAAPGVGVGV